MQLTTEKILGRIDRHVLNNWTDDLSSLDYYRLRRQVRRGRIVETWLVQRWDGTAVYEASSRSARLLAWE